MCIEVNANVFLGTVVSRGTCQVFKVGTNELSHLAGQRFHLVSCSELELQIKMTNLREDNPQNTFN